MISWYLRLMSKRPLLTTAVSTGVLMASGDVISQTVIEKRHINGGFELTRTIRFFGFGTLLGGPVLRLWYYTLDARLPALTAFRPVKMMLVDQALFAPVFLLGFCSIMGALKGETLDEIQDGLSQNYWSILLNNYKLWPAAQLINFYVTPLQYRVLFVNTVALGWNTYIAWKIEHDNKSDQL